MTGRYYSRLSTITFGFLFSLLTAVLFIADVRAQLGNGIYEPADGDTISGIVVIRGTADDPDFLRYELAFRYEFAARSDWIAFAQGDMPVTDDTLAIWDTTVGGEISPVFPDGNYQLRLRVVRNDYNYDEFFTTNLLLANLSLTPTVTTTLTQTVEAITTTPLPATIIAATRGVGNGLLPTLTPFPSPTPGPTPANVASPPDSSADNDGDEGGLFGRLAEIDISRFGTAFWYGVTIVAIAFAAFAGYLLIRGFVRWMLRQFSRG